MNVAEAVAAAGSNRWARRSVPWLGALFIAVIVGLAAYDIVRGYRASVDDTQRELQTQARVVAEQTARAVQAVDLVLRNVAQQFHHGALATLGAEALHQYLREQAVGLTQIDGLAIHDSRGVARALSWLYPTTDETANVARLPGFAVLRDDPRAGLYVGPAVRSQSDGRWAFPIGRRLQTAGGDFAGTVGARGSIDYFREFYRDVQPDPGTAITLMLNDGTLLARHPPVEAALGQRFADFDRLLGAAGGPTDLRPSHAVSPVDGVDRFGAVRLVPDYPLAVVVTRDTAVALAPWRAQATGTAVRTLALGLLTALLLAIVMRQLARLDAARTSLEASRDRFALAVAGSDDGIWDWDWSTERVFASARAREILGLPPGPESLPTDDWFALLRIHPDDVERRSTALQEHLAGRAPAYECELRLQQADASWRWIRVRGVCVRDAAGQPLRMAGSMSDIDARKRAEEALRLSEERYAVAMTGSNEGHWVWNVATDELFASPMLKEIFDLPPDAPLTTRGAFFEQIAVHADDRVPVQRAWEDLLAGHAPRLEIDYRIIDRSGRTRWIHSRGQCFRDADGRSVRVAGATVDISQRKRAEAALRESEEQKALAVAGSNDGILYWDIEHDTMYTSERAMRISGIESAQTVRSRAEWMALLQFHPDDVERHAHDVRENLEGRVAVREGEYRLRHPDGQYRWVRVRGICLRDADGRPTRWGGSVSDIDARKRAEEALRLSQERYALAMAGSNEGHWVWDIKTDHLFASPMLNRIYGLPADVQVTTMADYIARLPIHPDDRARLQNFRSYMSPDSSRFEVEYRFIAPDSGETRWVMARGQCFVDAEGKPERFAGATVDVTKRKRMEEALRAGEERFALAVAGSDDGVWDWDFVANVAFESARARELQGLPPGPEQQPLPNLLQSLRVHPEDAPRRAEGIRAHLAGETPAYEVEYRVSHDDGSYRWVRVRALCTRDAAGKPVRMAGSVSDIDARKRTEEALRESEERYQLAVAGSNEGMWDWDMRRETFFFSARAQELLGLEPGAPMRPCDDWWTVFAYHPDDEKRVKDALQAYLGGAGTFWEVEYRIRHHRTGQWHWYRERGVALRDAAGQPYRMAGSMEDISVRKRAEAERDRLELQLRQSQKLEAMGTLAGGIAHDFNNILAAILGYGEMAQKDAADGSAQRRHIDAALSAGMRAKSLVERILAFSRSGVGERVPVHVESVVTEALDVVAASLPRGVKLERALAVGNAAVLGDATQIHQVVMNLCANAVQAMKSRGVLRVAVETVELAEPRMVSTCLLRGGPHVRLVVHDSGAGIAPQLLERIFDPFFTTKEIGVGTGLGLSLVHGIVTDLGGGIDVESRVGEGSRFTVYVPWQGHVEPRPAVDEPLAGGAGETILLVDDEEPLVRLGEEMMAGLGYEPVGFASSSAALAAFRAEPDRFDVVLSDEAMPGMTGCELAREIRALRPDIPIVLMSGYVSAALTARAREAGVGEVLSKPLVSRDIARCLAGALADAPAVAESP